MDKLHIAESTPIDSVVYELKASDRANPARKFSYHISGDTFRVDELTGEVRLVRPLDRERLAQHKVVVSVFDADDKNDVPVETRRRTVYVDDVDDCWPTFMANTRYSLEPAVQVLRQPSGLASGAQQPQVASYQVEVSELTALNTIVIGEIQVIDQDEGANAEIVFECRAKLSSNSACDVFSTDSHKQQSGKYSLKVRLRKMLDYEQVQNYKLVVAAKGKRASPLRNATLESEAVINIVVQNAQDEGPRFINAPYSLSMPEGLRPGTQLLELLVQDGDAEPRRELNVIVVPSPYSKYFTVSVDEERRVWYLTTNTTIDRESPLISDAGNLFSISLMAVEFGQDNKPVASEQELLAAMREPAYASTTLRRENVTIVVLDLPDSRPVFVRTSSGELVDTSEPLVFTMSESIASGASIPNLDLSVLDSDEGINSRFQLELRDAPEGPRASHAFALESRVVYGKSELVLNVLNASLLDYEVPALRSYRFNITASKPSGAARSAAAAAAAESDALLEQTLELRINIVDANDNAPEFDKDQYVIELPEGTPPGTQVAVIKARDRDSGPYGHVSYVLRGAGASKFKLITSEGRILVHDCGIAQCLDYEVQPSFSLTYEAHDGGGKTRNVSVIINLLDVNDHAPRFSELVYKRELITDNLSSKQNYISPQLIVRARDDDGPLQGGRGNLTYRIKSTNLSSLDVEPNTGLVYFTQPIDLDNMIANMAAVSGRPVPADRKIVFEAEVVAEDNGWPVRQNASARIVLVVKGNSDGAPVFKHDVYQVSVREDQPPLKPFFRAQAHDPDDKDSQLRYSLGFDQNDIVTVDATTGDVAFKQRIDYDDFKSTPYNVTVFATDNSKPYPLRASAIVSIDIEDVNNKAPKFDEREYRATLVQGRARAGDLVLQVQATDLDKNALLNYSIVADKMFVQDRNGLQFSLDDLANATTGYVAQISKSDRNELVANLRRLFAINPKTGAIELRAEPDYSFAAATTILVHVQDLKQDTSVEAGAQQEDMVVCTFYMQAHSDKSPVFAPPWTPDKRTYNVSILEELPINSQIFSLLAKDPVTNQRVESYEKVLESDARDYFRVDKLGGVFVNRRIDYEELPSAQKRLSVSVKASSAEGFSSVAHLHVQVIDLNDNAPQFRNQSYSVQVSEAATYPHELVQVQADDRDAPEHARISYSLSGYSAELFAIDARKGVISVRKNAKLDRDTEPRHSLVVTASDCNDTAPSLSGVSPSIASSATLASGLAVGGVQKTPQQVDQSSTMSCKKSTTLVNIELLDENDNEPAFVGLNKRAELEALVAETAAVGSPVAQVNAVDPDDAANGQVSFEIVRNDEPISRVLTIDRDGFIKVAEPLSGLGRVQPYRVSIRAYDHGAPAHNPSGSAKQLQQSQSFATLVLTVTDVVANDGVPRFIRPRENETVSLSESVGPHHYVYQVQAIDPDEESNGKLMYKFIQPSDVFDIDPFTGVIKTQHRANFYLDRELTPSYTLIVVAQDLGTPPKQAHRVLVINIADVNDNEPYFARNVDDGPIVMRVEEETTRNGGEQLIGSVRALDKDVGENALIGYEIIDGNTNNLFRLDYEAEASETGNNPCKIIATGRLDREQRDSYLLTLRATSMSRLRNHFMHHHQQQQQIRDPLGNRNPFNQYNASDLTKVRVLIKLLDINDNRPQFTQSYAKSVVDSSAETYSQLLVFSATDADSSDAQMDYSILDVLFYSDAKLRSANELASYDAHQPMSLRHAFDLDARTGVLRNAVTLRPYIDGYFEIYVKAEASESTSTKCYDDLSLLQLQSNKTSSSSQHTALSFGELESCRVAVTKATVFVTHQREMFRFVFNKTKLNDRIDEFRDKIQRSLEELMFEPTSAASTAEQQGSLSATAAAASSKPERVFLNTFNTDFYEREDGSLDFSTLTSCSQLVKFDEASSQLNAANLQQQFGVPQSQAAASLNANQVIGYDEVVSLLRTLNATQTRQQRANLFAQYGLLAVERCTPDRTMYRMSPSERVALYIAIMIIPIALLLALIVRRARNKYERNLKLLQRSKYQYMSQYATLPPQAQPHHMSMAALPVVGPYAGATQMDFEPGAANFGYDTWQM